ncbi:MAG TPA: hypothetical protein DDY58_01900 [Terrisporobacter glycolicus]|uniref:hypothetical protein n=1 Tax=Terrisporobacter TaxID=1505652 RepID=UPI000E8B7424|nr:MULTISPECIES: hypothetical protein [Terrisporobacter]HBI91279.1 hypothetical protein [Terrisporobacter hibernicus]
MGLGDLRNLIEQYDGDIKRMEMDKQMENFKKVEELAFDQREELRKLAEAGEIEQNSLAAYSTTALKKELRRRKGKTK